MTPALRTRLQEAFDHVAMRKREGMEAGTIIAELVGQHRATFTTRASTNTLRVAGVTTSCTWSKDEGLLSAWISRAAVKLMEPAGGYGAE